MLRKFEEAEINPDDPWSGDQLERSQTASQLTRILETVIGPLVVSVSAPFGMGKTYFAKRWVADLNRQHKTAIHFNAWESDFAENPLVAFMDALRVELGKLNLPKTKKVALTKRIKEVVKVGAPALAKTAARASARAAGYVLVGDKVDGLAEAALKGVADEVEKIASAQIDAFAAEREARVKFKEELGKLRDAIIEARASGDNSESSKDQKIYLVIDELDRCRPPYALEFLEAIKHLFDVPGFIFVLVVDEEQLLSSAGRIYGVKPDGEDYLRKFIDYRFRLPTPSYEASARYLYKTFQLSDVLQQDENDTIFGRRGLVEGFSYFASHLGLSLRSQIHAFSIINLVLRAYGPTYLPVLSALVCLREARSQRWKEFLAEKISYEHIAAELGFDKEMTRDKDEDYWYLHHVLRIFFVEEPLKDSENMSNVDAHALSLLRHMGLGHRDQMRFQKVDSLKSKIELVEQISS